MNQITFPRKSYFGDTVEKPELEEWFLYGNSKILNVKKNHYNLVKEIGKRLKKTRSAKTKDEKRILNFIYKNLDKILIYTPVKLEKLTKIKNEYFSNVFINSKGKKKYTKFHDKLLKAFNYNSYRDNKLRDLACFLNVKSCPYCNMSYTLFAENGKTYSQMETKFQFDHFYGKEEYPFLSMSLYNLIPSCAICNQKKSTKHLSLNFHPYFNGINKQFHFKVENPLPLIFGATKDKINIDLELENRAKVNKKELEDYDKLFDIKLRYSRHRDVVQEVFDKAYSEMYYGDSRFFEFLDDKFKKEYLYRIIYGTYMDENEIEKRPMSKFIQDIRKQAIDKICYDYTNGWCY